MNGRRTRTVFAIGLWTAALIVGCGGGNSRTLSDRYAPRFREQAKRLHAEFWELRDAPHRRFPEIR